MKRQWCMMACALATVGVALMAAPGAFGQVTDVRILDLGAEITAGTAQVTYVPEFTGDPLKPFDGSPFTEVAVFNTDSLAVTLAFDSLTNIQQSNVFVWSDMTWTLESAESMSDLDSKTGTYSLLAVAHPGPAFAWDSVSFAARDVSCRPPDHPERVGAERHPRRMEAALLGHVHEPGDLPRAHPPDGREEPAAERESGG